MTSGAVWETFKSGRNSWTGTITAIWAPADTTGQGVMLSGASLNGVFYVDGDSTGDTKYTGSYNVEGIGTGVEAAGNRVGGLQAAGAWRPGHHSGLSIAPSS